MKRVSTWWCAATVLTGTVMAQTPQVAQKDAAASSEQAEQRQDSPPAPPLAQNDQAPSSSGPSQTSQPPAADTQLNEVVVTGSRIRNGNNTPTPVTSVSNLDLQATTPTSIPDALQKLPAFTYTASPNSAVNANGRGFGTPGNFLNLRDLGTIRTLILQDGNRVPGTFYDTTVDTNMLPQMLIDRVEVVTGGASSVYGSDAVSGVVNFITDSKFTGLKGMLQGGESTYGDTGSYRAGLAYGTNFAERGHFEASVEYYHRNGIDDTASRPYGNIYPAVVGSGSASNPYRLISPARQSNTAPGGLIVTGPLAGMQFLSNGTLAPFNPGTPTPTANAAIGGDGGYTHNEWLLPTERTAQGFARFDYDFTDSLSGYISGRYSDNYTFAASQIYVNTYSGTSPAGGSYPIWLYSGNPYIPTSVQDQLTATGTNSFALNRFDNDLMAHLGLKQNVKAGSGTMGLKGNLVGDFQWDAHYTYGSTQTRFTSVDNMNTRNFYAAIDAVRDPASGNIVCRVTLTNPAAFPGCQPLNVIGQGNGSPAAVDYVLGNTFWTAQNKLNDVGANVNGTILQGWAGPWKTAVGVEFRHASLAVTTSTANDSFDPSGLRLGPNGLDTAGNYPASNLAWFKEVQSGANGSENVYEGNLELDVPLLKDLPLVDSLSFNGAYRYAHYKASGNGEEDSAFHANTWKGGIEWKINDWVRLRGTRSQEFRAPTLWDLYQRQVISASGVTDNLTKVAAQLNTVSGGNPNLQPEIAANWTGGIMLTPQFTPGFSLSVDYFHININNAIATVSGVDPLIQGICLGSGGASPYCGYVVRPISYNSTSPANFPTLNYSLNQNVAHIKAEGFDLEENYTRNLADWGLAGQFGIRTLWSHQPTLATQTIPSPSAVVTNAAGTQVLPKDKVALTFDYTVAGFGIDILQRWNAHVHQSANPTLVYAIPDVASYYQTDLNLSYQVPLPNEPLQVFFNVSNLFNAKGGIFQDPGYTGSIGLRYPTVSYADVIGRYFTLGVRFKFQHTNGI
jgi:iron complex outermembrane recepter protein